jgi:hypothetical protein
MTPSQARNAIRKCLKSIIAPRPDQADVDRLWDYFGACCAYCRQQLDRGLRNAHVDHLVAESNGGSNRLANLVLSCGKCNGDEKREASWEDFLVNKCGANTQELQLRRAKILDWIELNGSVQVLANHQIEPIEAAFNRINTTFTACVGELRAKRDA